MKKFGILGGAALLAIAGTAVAQQADAPRRDRSADMTRQQVVERTQQRFARLDVNQDGQATLDEARQAREQRRAERAGRAFDRLDLDHDGSITRAEFDQGRSQRQQARAERREARGHHRGMRHRRHARAERMFGEQGVVTLAQLQERALARFDRLDLNHDGTLTAAERRQAREQRRQQRQERRRQAD